MDKKQTNKIAKELGISAEQIEVAGQLLARRCHRSLYCTLSQRGHRQPG